jgi:hypothetical protein
MQVQLNTVRMCGALVSDDCLQSQSADSCVSQLIATIEAERSVHQGPGLGFGNQALVALPVCTGRQFHLVQKGF